jgi:type II secretory pathway pseudopilin PulG
LGELAIVLGVIGLILGAIWTATQSVSNRNAANQAAQELQTVSLNMLTLYQNRALPPPACAGGSDITANAISAGTVPSNYVLSGGGGCSSGAHAWSSTVHSFVIYSVGSTFRLAFYNIPESGCISLLLQATSCDPTQSGCPQTVYTGGSYGLLPAPNKNSAIGTGPPMTWAGLTPAVATTLCSHNAAPNAGGANSVEFDFHL